MVQSINGKITNDFDPHIHSWTSEEDQVFFNNIRDKHSVIVMGSKTYEVIKEFAQKDTSRRRIILTKNPGKYAADKKDKVREFTSIDPKTLITQLENEGVTEILLVGGGETNKAFFEAKLITDVYLTIEPVLFGKGNQMTVDGTYQANLTLLSHKTLNDKGTLLLHYSVSY